MLKSAKVFGAACAVYFAMAACGAAERTVVGAASDAGPSELVDGIAAEMGDSLTNPVDSAMAGPGAPEVAAELCDKTYMNGASTIHYAEHSYPGKSVAELASVVAILNYSAGQVGLPPGYTSLATTTFVKAGGVAAGGCTSGQSVTFVRP